MPPLLPAAAGGPNPQDGSVVPKGPCTTVGSMSLAPLLTRKSEDALPDTMGLTADREGCATDPAKQCSAGRRAIRDNNRTRSNPPAVAPDCPPPGNLGTAERFDRDPTADKPGSQSHDRAGKWHPGTGGSHCRRVPDGTEGYAHRARRNAIPPATAEPSRTCRASPEVVPVNRGKHHKHQHRPST